MLLFTWALINYLYGSIVIEAAIEREVQARWLWVAVMDGQVHYLR